MYYHLKIILRNLRRNFTYSAINIAGLPIGITTSVLIFLWVHHERSFNRYHSDVECIYRVFNSSKFGDGDPWINEVSPYPLALAIGRDIPEVESVALMYSQIFNYVRVNDELFSVGVSVVHVNKTWLDMFSYVPVDGSLDAFGNHPFSVVLTEPEAAKYFGKSRAVGQIININNTDYTVQAIVKDNPSNSSFRYNVLASTDVVLRENMQQNWNHSNVIIFAKLHPSANVAQVCEKINNILAKNERTNTTAYMRPLPDIHFETDMDDYYIVHGNKRMVSIFGLLGILLVCTACINYVNLTTARANIRSKEIGMKKIVGARRSALFVQLISEAFICCLIAAVLSLLFIVMLLPQYQMFVGNIGLSFTSPVIWTVVGIVLLAITVLNGVYPALALSSFHPMNFLQGVGLLKVKNSSLRRGLVIFQFTLSVTLIVSVIVIYQQMRYVQNMNPGYNREQIFTVKIPNSSALQSVKGELQSFSDIAGVAVCNGNITNIGAKIGAFNDWEGRADDFNPELHYMYVDADYGQLLGLKMADGRWFNENNAADENNVILNQTAIRQLNIHEPHIGQRFTLMGGVNGYIIGIVEDFHFRSLHEKTTPLVLHHSPLVRRSGEYLRFTIKTHQGKHAEAIQAAKSVWTRFFPNEPFEYIFLDDAFNNLYQSDTRTSQLILMFSILAVIIAVLGLFGLSTFAIERRTKEIGIRKILGASVSSIVYLLTREFLLLVAVAFTIAAPISWWAMSRWLENFAYRIDISVWIFVAGAMVTLVIALAAVGIQAIKAATENPVKAIKSE